MPCQHGGEILHRCVPVTVPVSTTAAKAVTQDKSHTRAAQPTCTKLDASRPSRMRNTFATRRFFDWSGSQNLRSLMSVEFSRDSSWTNVRKGASVAE